MLILVGLAFLCGTGLVVGGYVAMVRLSGRAMRQRVDARLLEISHPLDAEAGLAAGQQLLKAKQSGFLSVVDKTVGGWALGARLRRWIDQAGVRKSVSAVLLSACMSGATVGLLALAIMRVGWALPLGMMVGGAAPFTILKHKRSRRLRAFEEAFPEALDLISRALKAGHAFSAGIKMVADEAQDPVGPEFRKTFDEQNFGLPLKDALDNLSERVPIIDVRFFATAVLIQRETGGNLAEILESLAHVVRERFKILRQVRVYTAHGRMTGYVLLALPAVLCLALGFINPDHMNVLFKQSMGRTLLLAAVVMQTVGFFWIRQVVKIEV